MNLFNKLRDFAARLHNDERGEIPVGPILVIALIVIPLVVMLALFRDNITKFLSDQYAKLSGKEDAQGANF